MFVISVLKEEGVSLFSTIILSDWRKDTLLSCFSALSRNFKNPSNLRNLLLNEGLEGLTLFGTDKVSKVLMSLRNIDSSRGYSSFIGELNNKIDKSDDEKAIAFNKILILNSSALRICRFHYLDLMKEEKGE